MSAPAETSAPSPLAAVHRDLGARFAPYRGVERPADYGSIEREAAALGEGCGLIDRSWLELIELAGDDRVRFSNALLTCDVAALEAGSGCRGFATSVKGRVLADLAVLALDDRLWIVLPAVTADGVAQHLGKYVIVERVTIERRDDSAAVTLAGPGLGAALGVELPEEPWRHREVEIAGARSRMVREADLEPPGAEPVPVVTLWLANKNAEALWRELAARPGVEPVGHRAWEQLRVEVGRGAFGQDFGPENFPQETGLEEQAVSYTKGCYLGQEVVARIHYRGGVNRRLRGLEIEAPEVAEAASLAGREVLSGGRAAGTVSSAVDSPTLGRVGLAVLHKRAAPGSRVELAGGGSAEVVELPFSARSA